MIRTPTRTLSESNRGARTVMMSPSSRIGQPWPGIRTRSPWGHRNNEAFGSTITRPGKVSRKICRSCVPGNTRSGSDGPLLRDWWSQIRRCGLVALPESTTAAIVSIKTFAESRSRGLESAGVLLRPAHPYDGTVRVTKTIAKMNNFMHRMSS
jgi:hypothetical protein